MIRLKFNAVKAYRRLRQAMRLLYQTQKCLLDAPPQARMYQHKRCGYIREKEEVLYQYLAENKRGWHSDFFHFSALAEMRLIQEDATTTE